MYLLLICELDISKNIFSDTSWIKNKTKKYYKDKWKNLDLFKQNTNHNKILIINKLRNESQKIHLNIQNKGIFVLLCLIIRISEYILKLTKLWVLF